MPIQVQCCGLVVMMVLFYVYKSQRTITLDTVKAFWNSFVITFINISLDIFSCIVIRFRESLPALFVDAVCKSYLASLAALAYFALLYILTDVYSKKSEFYKISISYGVFMGIAIIFIYILPINYLDDVTNKVIYSYGASDNATYVFALFTILFTGAVLIKQRGKITKNRRFAALVWISVWLVAAIVQFIRPELLLVGFANSVDMLVLYLILENPVNNIDKRTGLFNHGAFLQYTKQLYESESKFSALVMVLEHSSYKAMNSELEEEILGEASKYLIGTPDLYAFNNTGSEMILVMPEGEKGISVMNSVKERFEQGWGKNGGIFISPYWIFVPDSSLASGPEDLLHLIRYAKQNCDEKLYENRYVEVNHAIAEQLRNKREIEQLILDALDNDRLEVWYQPIYSTKLNRFTAAEALVRIRDKDGNLIPPGAFIETAESNGTILQIGETVFRKVCRFLSQNDLKQYGISYIEVNLSVVQCANKQLARDYIKIMKEYGITPDLINLEITESASTNTKNTLLDNMKELMDYGVNFSLDDFGTGQSNLDYIVDMPVDIVKFDKGMTNAYFENGKAKYIMDAATNMIHGMDLKIVSEGIETEEQFNTMQDLGISFIQGYYFSKPLPEKEFLEFIKNAREKESIL
ncbi:MAG: EAL domain-containing protein [Ruminiclostridium sp.]|nr:EAL domain-containing protein [Ruminiclostridium sp.]